MSQFPSSPFRASSSSLLDQLRDNRTSNSHEAFDPNSSSSPPLSYRPSLRVHRNVTTPTSHSSRVGCEKAFIVSIDFGTTFSAVAFSCVSRNEARGFTGPSGIHVVNNYPHDPLGHLTPSDEVPTESWYLDPGDNGSRRIHAQTSKKFYWGYGLQDIIKSNPDRQGPQNRQIKRSKLLLDKSNDTLDLRTELRPTLSQLKSDGLIDRDEDVIAQYLEHLLRHTKCQLEICHGFCDACAVEFVLCVPAMWTRKATRTMEICLAKAVDASGFSRLEYGALRDLFVVSEPEAAAAYVLEETKVVKRGETFVLLDAGGGTADASTFTLDRERPPRMTAVVGAPEGNSCGSSFLNENFQNRIQERLKDEDYLEIDGLTISGIVKVLCIEFENFIKRQIDVTRSDLPAKRLFIQGLRPNQQKRFEQNRLRLDRDDLREIFMPILEANTALLMGQLRQATDKGLIVTAVVVFGGLAGSPSLISHLTAFLRPYRIRLIKAPAPATAVARGGNLRAQDKTRGPKREILSSYGFFIREPFDPSHVGHRKARTYRDPLDGQDYVKTIYYMILKGTELLPATKPPPHLVSHTFPAEPDVQLLCEEELYVSDTNVESHYPLNHKMNKGAEVEGKILADMTFLREQGLIRPQTIGDSGKWFYKVEYDLVMVITGRNLRFEARYPPGQDGEARATGQISIAAAFVPGTE